MTNALRKYLDLETIMLGLEALDARAADAVRDVMDELWYQLSDADRRSLDERTAPGPFCVREEARLPLKGVLLRAPSLQPRQLTAREPIVLTGGWRGAA